MRNGVPAALTIGIADVEEVDILPGKRTVERPVPSPQSRSSDDWVGRLATWFA